ncbi:MAG: hypothetical protein DRQ51_04725 [Gammaproteobacteria bacterium]|nr:MAG: hypothetical protein DRQ51_04725 [Gammaproteobacteria bacterium]
MKTKTQQLKTHLLLSAIALTATIALTACDSGGGGGGGGSDSGGSSSSFDVGYQQGSPVSKNGYDSSGNHIVTATISPYSNGFKILFEPQSGYTPWICGLSVPNYLYQGGSQQQIQIIEKSLFSDTTEYYEGYVESGATQHCANYGVDTTWVYFANLLDNFNANSDYRIVIDDIKDTGDNVQSFDVQPY